MSDHHPRNLSTSPSAGFSGSSGEVISLLILLEGAELKDEEVRFWGCVISPQYPNKAKVNRLSKAGSTKMGNSL
jgi:hypothetical protein